jgi:hypothetical protein
VARIFRLAVRHLRISTRGSRVLVEVTRPQAPYRSLEELRQNHGPLGRYAIPRESHTATNDPAR